VYATSVLATIRKSLTKPDSRMLDRPPPPVGAVNVLVLAA
jgi:hypothetical protein